MGRDIIGEIVIMSLREKILKVNDIKTKKLHIKEWDVSIHIKQLTAKDLEEYHKYCNDNDVSSDRSKIVELCTYDDEGNKVFNSEDVKELNKKNGSVITYIFVKIDELNAIKSSDVEQEAKNS